MPKNKVEKNLNEYTVIVTGGTRGIGRGISESFLKEGATVIATYAGNDKAAEEFMADNQMHEGRVHVQKFDVTSSDQVKEFFSYVDDKFESVEVLVNNSGIRQDALTAAMTDEQWQKVIQTNLTGTFHMTREVISRFMRPRFGRIINISSIGGQLGLPGQANYAASKAGQIALSKSLSKEVAKRGITINNVLPGFIDTELLDGLPEEQISEYKKQVPMKRFGKVEEVAAAVKFLASPEAGYITGASLEISGGL